MSSFQTAQIARASGADFFETGAPAVLLVCEEEQTRDMLASVLGEDGLRCDFAADVSEARARLSELEYSVVLADADALGLSTVDLVMSVVKDHSATAVLILTQSRDPKLLTTVLEMGAAGYLVKPLLREEVMINISDALRRRARQSEDQRQREELGDLLSHRTDELETKTAQLAAAETEARFYRDEAVERLAAAAAMRGTESLGHIKRIGGYCELLARSMGESESHCDMIRQASKLHDIGMLAVPDHILFKREALSEEERKSMQSHTEIGHGILVGSESEVLSIAASVALTHHERVDGSGYPRGLRGEDIPLEGRIMAIADVFDGLASQRIYKSPVPTEQAIAEMRSIGEGKLDGDLLDLFVGSMEMVQAMVSEFDVG